MRCNQWSRSAYRIQTTQRLKGDDVHLLMRSVSALDVLWMLGTWPIEAVAWQLRLHRPGNYLRNPRGGERIHILDRAAPIHEQLTLISLGCLDNKSCKEQLARHSISVEDVLRGVRWNDFPAVYFTESPTGTCLNLRRATKGLGTVSTRQGCRARRVVQTAGRAKVELNR
jgi:hypothetical protein